MKLVRSPKQLQKILGKLKARGKAIGFVPTMGALHEGHLSLVRAARRENQIVVVSIFVNPLQFGPREDFKKYPRVFRDDEKLLRAEKVDFLFAPSQKSIYPGPLQITLRIFDLARPLCGAFRPGHFEGVATVVAKLFNLAMPDRAYFGAKDYQQSVVIRRLAGDLDFPLRIRVLPTVREKDGLAMSSRNRYLSVSERHRALAISKTIFWVRREIHKGRKNLPVLKAEARRKLLKEVDRLDYLEIVDPESLVSLSKPQPRMIAAVACFVGETRLIDNVTITA